jgi:hypothetical protein
LEVRRCGDGHPPVTEREGVIRLNGIGGVTFQTRIEFSIRVFLLMSFVMLSERCCNATHEVREASVSISDCSRRL